MSSHSSANSSSSISIISIPVSDEDSDDPSPRKRPRIRRRRRSSRMHGKAWIPRRFLRRAARLWPWLVFLPATVMLLFEASRVSVDPLPEVRTTKEQEPASPAMESLGNLNRLDRTTRVMNGVRQPCLKILPSEDIEKLDFPESSEPDFPVKALIYRSETSDIGTNQSGGDAALLPIRFNLFTGIQTLDERERSFKVNETAVIHCGFYSEKGGFKISDEDKNYMQNCEAVVSTCSFGGGDDLYDPIGMTEATLRKVCYVAFWDEITRSAQEAEGKRIGDDNMIGKWHVVIVKDLPFSDQRLNGKIPKMLAHRLFPHAKYSIWVDSKSQFRRDPLGVLEALLWSSKSVLAISEHGARSSLYDESRAVVKKNKATPDEVNIQISQYRHDGFPDDKRFRGKKALSEASIIVREHTPSTNMLMCLWFNEVVRFTSRDQLSFPYVLRRLGTPGINMFPVCTRKDLVNSMGHKRKVKPLATT